MLKYNHQLKAKGSIDVLGGTLTATDKDGNITGVYRLQDLFSEFDGKTVDVTISEKYERNGKDIEDEEQDEE